MKNRHEIVLGLIVVIRSIILDAKRRGCEKCFGIGNKRRRRQAIMLP